MKKSFPSLKEQLPWLLKFFKKSISRTVVIAIFHADKVKTSWRNHNFWRFSLKSLLNIFENSSSNGKSHEMTIF